MMLIKCHNENLIGYLYTQKTITNKQNKTWWNITHYYFYPFLWRLLSSGENKRKCIKKNKEQKNNLLLWSTQDMGIMHQSNIIKLIKIILVYPHPHSHPNSSNQNARLINQSLIYFKNEIYIMVYDLYYMAYLCKMLSKLEWNV